MLSKKYDHKRLRPKATQKNKSKITAHEKEYLEWLQYQPFKCFSCHTYEGIVYHHIKNHSTDKKRHTVMLPLCTSCHVGNEFSAHGTVKLFKERFSIEVQEQQAKYYYEIFLKECSNR